MPQDTLAEKIEQAILARIREGGYEVGGRLPPERKLMELYGASRDTVRRALRSLEAHGYIQRQGAAGTFVLSRADPAQWDGEAEETPSSFRASEQLTGGNVRFTPSRLGGGALGAHDLLQVTDLEPMAFIPADKWTARRLEIAAGTQVLRRHRLVSRVHGPALHLIEAYYPGDLFAEYLDVDASSVSPYEWLLSRHGRRAKHVLDEVLSRLPSPPERAALRMSGAAPVLVLKRTVVDQHWRVIEWTRTVAPAASEKFLYQYDLPE